MSYKILCLDGGGIRGVFSLEILKMLQDDLGKDVILTFDCFSGTSTGAIIASALLSGFQPRDLIHFYTIFGRKIFPKKRKSVTNEAKYSNEFLQTILRTTISEKTTLADLKKHLVIPACVLSDSIEGRWGVEIFDNYNIQKAKEWNLVDTALRSAAAPIYFPSYQNYIDGGIYALNPSLLAFSRSLDPLGGNKNISDIKILSIGTGINPIGIQKEIDWGLDQWLSQYKEKAYHPLFSLITEIGALIPDYPLQQILKENYVRINTVLKDPIEIDDPSKISELRASARNIKEKSPKLWDTYLNWFTEK
jgi:patatin-like phospholipase/acyl hydrolase